MKVIIDDLTKEQAECIAKAISYHLANEGTETKMNVPNAKDWAERSSNLPRSVKLQVE